MLKRLLAMPIWLTCVCFTFAQNEGIELFEESNFGGKKVQLYREASDLQGQLITCRSIRVHQGWEAIVYSGKEFDGVSMTLRSDLPTTENTPFHAGSISSVRIWESNQFWPDLPEPFDSGVVLFSEPGFQGQYEFVDGRIRNLDRKRIGTGRVNSIFVHPGFVAQLYRDRYYEGPSVTLFESDSDLGLTAIGRDALSSIVVTPNPMNQQVRAERPDVDFNPFLDMVVDVHVDDLEDAVAVTAGAILIHALIKSARNHDKKKSYLGVTFYSGPNYGGVKQTFRRNIRKMNRTWFGENQACSIDIPNGYEVTLYEHKRYRGRSVTLDQSCPDLNQTDVGNQEVSSFRLRWVGE